MEFCLINVGKLKKFKLNNPEFKEGDEITFTVGGFQYTMKFHTIEIKTKQRKLRAVWETEF